MPDPTIVNINELPLAADILDTDNFITERDGIAYRAPASLVLSYVGGTGGGGGTLATPTSFTVTPGDTVNVLDWADVVDATSYTVDRATDSGFTTGVSLAIYTGATSGYTDTGRTNGVTYYYRVYATAVGFTNSGYATGNGTPAATSYQTESTAFFASNTGLTTPEKDAVDALVIALKAIGWSKFHTVYPFVGGTASAHKWNLINPADTDGAFRAVFNGTITHTSNGITGDGASGYVDTFLSPDTVLANDFSQSVFSYVRNNVDGYVNFGYASGAGSVGIRRISGSVYGEAGTNQSSVVNGGASAITRTVITSRTADNVLKLFRDGTQLGSTETTVNASSTSVNQTLVLLAEKANTTVSTYSPHNIALWGYAAGLTDGECASLRTAIDAYELALSRNV